MSLIELAHLFRAGPARLRLDQEHVYQVLETATLYHIFPITIPIAREFGAILTPLQDPADAIIAATARVHGLRLLTSDQRIIKANVVSTIE